MGGAGRARAWVGAGRVRPLAHVLRERGVDEPGDTGGGYRLCGLPVAAHIWATIDVVGKLLDLLTDVGSFVINYGMVGDTSNRFYRLYEFDGGNDADVFRIAALVSLVLGTLCWLPDVYCGYRLKRHGDVVGAKVWSALSFVFEDVPQLVLAVLYADAVRVTELAWDDEGKIMFAASIALSCLTILGRLFVICCIGADWLSQSAANYAM